MNRRATLALGLVALALLGYIAAFERGSPTSKELTQRSSRVLATFVRDKVERLEIQRKGRSVVLVRKPLEEGAPSGWRLQQPEAAEADEDAVDQLLGELEWLTAQRTLEQITAEDRRRFGLDAPRARVSYHVDGKRYVLALGNGDVHGDSVYAQLAGEARAFVVPKSLLDALAQEPGHFREKQLFPELTVAWARKLTITQAGVTGELTRAGARWWLELAPRGYADDGRVDELLHALAELRATRHLEREQGAPAAPSQAPAMRIELRVVPDEGREDQTAKLLQLELFERCAGHEQERRVQVRGGAAGELAVCVRQDDLARIEVAANELRDLRLVRTKASEVERIELVRGADELVLVRAGEQWKAERGVAGDLDREAVEAWLADLAQLRAIGFAPASSFSARGKLVLVRGENKREQINLGELSPAGTLLVQRDDEPLHVTFPGAAYDRLLPSARRFAPLELWAERQPSEIVRIEARVGDKARVLALEGGAWQLAGGAQPVDAARTRELVRALLDLRALAFVAEQPRAVHALSHEGDRVQLSRTSGAPLSLEFGAATERGAYARVDGRALVEVSREALALVTELAGGPRALPPAHHPSAEQADEDDEEHDHAH